MKEVILHGSDHMDSSNTILPSRLVTDASEQFIYPGRKD